MQTYCWHHSIFLVLEYSIKHDIIKQIWKLYIEKKLNVLIVIWNGFENSSRKEEEEEKEEEKKNFIVFENFITKEMMSQMKLLLVLLEIILHKQ